MSSPAHLAPLQPTGAAVRTGGPGTAAALPYDRPAAPYGGPHPMPDTTGAPSAALRVACSRQGLAHARSFTRDTLRLWSLDHRCEDAALVITELATNAVTHAAPRCAGAPDVRLGFRLERAHLLLTVSDPDDRPPVPGAGSALEEHGRGLCIVDALSEAWGWTPTPPTGKTVWARLSARRSI
ncbi:ATP-binding protein [Streptomyces prasinosporus]|uniref:ATP-binding protein n=1 Tax=Streptomyces prasinosporus TaxID=68256 RepID=A0ABP6THS8_9ACTN